MTPSRRILFAVLILTFLFTSAALSACATSAGPEPAEGALAMAPMENMPAEVKSAPTTVQQAYQFAVANPDILKQIPCYCGCGKMGHTSNYSCYVQGVDEKGNIIFDTHALGCSICVDITQDSMRLLGQGKALSEIKTSIDQTYSRYGSPNIP